MPISSPQPLTAPSGDKRSQRKAALEARARLAVEERAKASRAIAAQLERLQPFASARIVGLYAAMGAEVDTAEIARRALARGQQVAWPFVVAGERPLQFAACGPEALVRGPLGFDRPPEQAPRVALDALDCILVPGVAFDLACHRLGRGGGHYDATLALLPARAARIALAFEVQILSRVEREPHDLPLDLVVTERRVLSRPEPAGQAPGGAFP